MNNSTSLNYTLSSRYRRNNLPIQELIKSLRYTLGIVEGVLSPVIIIVNIAVIVVILSNPKLRHKFSYLVIVSISISDLITGLVSCPVRANVVLARNFNHGCATYMFITVYEDFVQNFVASWSVVSLNTDYLFTMFNARLPKLSELRRKLVLATSIFLPWLIMCCIVFPIAFIYHGKVYVSDKFCQISLNRTGKVVILNIAYVLPAILLAIQVILMTTTWTCRRRNGSSITSEAIPMVMLIVASTVVVVFVSPQQLSYLLGRDKMKMLGYKGILTMIYTRIAIADLTAAVLPFVWFLCPDIRAPFLVLYNKMPWRSSVDFSKGDLAVTYKNFE